MVRRCRAVSNTVPGLTGPRFEPQTFHPKTNAIPTGRQRDLHTPNIFRIALIKMFKSLKQLFVEDMNILIKALFKFCTTTPPVNFSNWLSYVAAQNPMDTTQKHSCYPALLNNLSKVLTTAHDNELFRWSG